MGSRKNPSGHRKPEAVIRVQKYIADRGHCSRRKADELVLQGRVTVDGKIARPGTKVNPEESAVVVDGKPLSRQRTAAVTLAMNKPRGYICSHDDPYNEKTIFDLVPQPFNRERLLCAGRLDKDSEGLLVITTDGELVQKIAHPSSHVLKRYRVSLNREFETKDIAKMLSGILFEGERLQVDRVIPAKKGPGADRRLEIHTEHGKKREIRRLLEGLGYRVERLQRIAIGGLTIRGIGVGKVRLLREKEIRAIFG